MSRIRVAIGVAVEHAVKATRRISPENEVVDHMQALNAIVERRITRVSVKKGMVAKHTR